MKEVIKRAGNLCQFEGGSKYISTLKSVLTYNHVSHERGNRSNGFKSQRKTENRAMYSVSDQGDLLFAAGLTDFVIQELEEVGVSVDFQDLRPKERRLPPPSYENLRRNWGGELSFRKNQPEVLQMIAQEYNGIVNAPAGLGKSFILEVLVLLYPKTRMLFIVPGAAVLKSIYKRVKTRDASVGLVNGSKNQSSERVVCASPDSLHKVHLNNFDLIIYDECHTAATPSRLPKLCMFSHATFFGFSASFPGRADGADAVVESLFGPVRISISDDQAVEDGAIAPRKLLTLPVVCNYNTDDVSENMFKKKSYVQNHFRHQAIADSIKVIKQYLRDDDPQILILVEFAEHAVALQTYLPDFEVVYDSVAPTALAPLLRGKFDADVYQEHVPEINELVDRRTRKYVSGWLSRNNLNWAKIFAYRQATAEQLLSLGGTGPAHIAEAVHFLHRPTTRPLDEYVKSWYNHYEDVLPDVDSVFLHVPTKAVIADIKNARLIPQDSGFSQKVNTVANEAQCTAMDNILQRLDPAYESMYMSRKKLDTLLTDFESGSLRRVIATAVWKQGINAPQLSAVVRADGGASIINDIQINGRVSRLSNGKPFGLVVDFLDLFGRRVYNRAVSRRKRAEKMCQGVVNLKEERPDIHWQHMSGADTLEERYRNANRQRARHDSR